MWTKFWDMHSGGGQKEKWGLIFIEAPMEEAKVIFYNRFGHNPERVTCTCCGDDYSISEEPTLKEASAFHRNCAFEYFFKSTGKPAGSKPKYDRKQSAWCVDGEPVEGRYVEHQDPNNSWGKYQTLAQFLKSGEALAIYAKDIKPSERRGEVPEQGYVWMG